MYRRPKFLEILLEIRREMAHEADYDVDLFAEIVRSGSHSSDLPTHSMPAPDGSAINGNGKPVPSAAKRVVKT